MFMRSCMDPQGMVKLTFVHTWVIGKAPTYRSLYLIAFLLLTNHLFRIKYVCVLRFLFSSCLFLSISFGLCCLIYPQLVMDGVFILCHAQKQLAWRGSYCGMVSAS